MILKWLADTWFQNSTFKFLILYSFAQQIRITCLKGQDIGV